MKKTVLKEYAKLIVRMGANVQKGQNVIINAGLDQPEFVKLVVEECYKAKAREVILFWNYQPLEKIHARYQSVKTMGTVHEWQKARQQHYCDTLPCRLHIISEDPDGLKGMNMDKVTKARQMSYPILKPYRDRRENREQWCIAAVPGKAWAKKVFPGERTSVAMEKLWQVILSCSRVNEDPVKAWEEHNRDLHDRCAHLNSLKIRSLHYTADNGTDLTVGMIPEGMWRGGGDTSLQGIFFNPNIPTEECFISPMKGQAEGIVYSTKPLSYRGQLLDLFQTVNQSVTVDKQFAGSFGHIQVVLKELIDGKEYKLKGKGLLAQAISHEVDHLNGVLFVDKIIPGTMEIVGKK